MDNNVRCSHRFHKDTQVHILCRLALQSTTGSLQPYPGGCIVNSSEKESLSRALSLSLSVCLSVCLLGCLNHGCSVSLIISSSSP